MFRFQNEWISELGVVFYGIAVLLINLFVAIVAWQRQSLSRSGAAAATLVGALTLSFLGWGGWVTLMAFFVSSSLLSHVTRQHARQVAPGLQKKGGQRDYMQVLANGGLSTLSAILYSFFGLDIFILSFGLGVAASNSDTWAGEIGILSKTRPVLPDLVLLISKCIFRFPVDIHCCGCDIWCLRVDY
jgi:uncharacterized protein (TIGR00297 family)